MISADVGAVGGLENAVSEISTVLTKHDVQVTIFNSHSRDATEVYKNCTIKELVPYKLLPYGRHLISHYDRYAYSLKVWRKIKRLDRFDIIHGHGDNSFFPALLRDKTPFVGNIHGIKRAYYYRIFGPNYRKLKDPRQFPLFWPEKMLAKRSDVVVACSKAERDDLVAFLGINPAKIKLIYNGIDLNKYAPMSKRTARRLLGLPENKNYAIWVGNNPFLKGLETAIRAVKDLKNVCLLIVGISGTNFENVLFRGRIDDFRLLRLHYNAADFLIFPTRFEGFPLVPMEALACGLPLIISKECPTREIMTDGVEGFIVDQRKPECYAEKIRELLRDWSQNQEVSLRCRALAEKYSWEKAGKEYLRLYSKLL